MHLPPVALSSCDFGGSENSTGLLNAFRDAIAGADNDIAFVGQSDPSFYASINGEISTIKVLLVRLATSAVDFTITASDAGIPPRMS